MGCTLGTKFEANQAQGFEKSKKNWHYHQGFFHILYGEYLLKHKFVVLETPEWKFKANIVTNSTAERHFCPIWVKNVKKLTLFNNFILVSQS